MRNLRIIISVVLLFAMAGITYAERLPVYADDYNSWGNILNNYLLECHTVNGSLKASCLTNLQNESNAFKNENVTAFGYQIEANAFKNINATNVKVNNASRADNVSWHGINDMPAGFADGTDDTGASSSPFTNENISTGGGQLEASAWKLANTTAREANYFLNENFTAQYDAITSRWLVANQTAREANYWLLENTTAREANYFKDGNFTTQFNAKLGAAQYITALWSFADVLINGNLFVQGNISQLNVTNLEINGSLFPPTGFTNTFDVGSATAAWRNGYFGTNLYVNNNAVLTEASAVFKNENVTAYGYQVEANAYKKANLTADYTNLDTDKTDDQLEAQAWKAANDSAALIANKYLSMTNATGIAELMQNSTINRSIDLSGYISDASTYQKEASAFKNANISTGGGQLEASAWKAANDSAALIANKYLSMTNATGIAELMQNSTINRSIDLSTYNYSVDLSGYALTSGLTSYQLEAQAWKLANTTAREANYFLNANATALDNIAANAINSSLTAIGNNITLINLSVTAGLGLKQSESTAWKKSNTSSYLQEFSFLNASNTTFLAQFGNVTKVSQIANDMSFAGNCSAANACANVVYSGNLTNYNYSVDLSGYALTSGLTSYQLEASAFKLANVTALAYQKEADAWKVANTTAREANYYLNANFTAQYDAITSRWLVANESSYLITNKYLSMTNATGIAELMQNSTINRSIDLSTYNYSIDLSGYISDASTYQKEASAWKLANTTAREANYFLNANFTAQYDAITSRWLVANQTAREANYWLKANSSAYLQEFSFLNSTNVTSSFGVSTTMPGSQNLINFVWTNLTDTQSNISLINASVTAALGLRQYESSAWKLANTTAREANYFLNANFTAQAAPYLKNATDVNFTLLNVTGNMSIGAISLVYRADTKSLCIGTGC